LTVPRTSKQKADRVERARRAFELTLAGNSLRQAAEIMRGEGYLKISHQTVANLCRDFAREITLPLAAEHVTREFERLMEQRLRLDAQRERAWEICQRFHMVTNNAGVVMMPSEVDPVTRQPTSFEPVRDSGPELQALSVMQGIEKLVLANAEALAKLFGYRAPEEKKLTVTTELDNAIADLVGEMNERPADVRT
jgi:transposase